MTRALRITVAVICVPINAVVIAILVATSAPPTYLLPPIAGLLCSLAALAKTEAT